MSETSEEQHAYHLHKMRTRFKRLDVNKDGVISREDFELMASKLLEYSNLGEIHAESVREAFVHVADCIGLKPGVKFPIEEAAREASRKMMAMTPEKQMAVLRSDHDALFDALDVNKDGHISQKEFKVYFQVIAPDISEAEMINSFNVIDENKNGEISRDEFLTAAHDFMFGEKETEISKAFFGHLLP